MCFPEERKLPIDKCQTCKGKKKVPQLSPFAPKKNCTLFFKSKTIENTTHWYRGGNMAGLAKGFGLKRVTINTTQNKLGRPTHIFCPSRCVEIQYNIYERQPRYRECIIIFRFSDFMLNNVVRW